MRLVVVGILLEHSKTNDFVSDLMNWKRISIRGMIFFLNPIHD